MYPISLSTSEELRLRLAAAATTNPTFVCSYADTNPEAVLTNTGTMNGTTPVVAAASPSAGRRIIRQLVIQNPNTADITLILAINTTDIYRITLSELEAFTLNGIYDQYGSLKTGVIGPQGPQGSPAPTELPEVAQTGNYTLQLSDALKFVTINSSSAATVTIPTNSAVAFPVGTQILVGRKGSGDVSIAPASGVNINGATSTLNLANQWRGVVTLWKYDTNDWWVFGGLA